MKTLMTLAIMLAGISAQADLPKEVTAPKFQFWIEEEVDRCEHACGESITLNLPESQVAENLAYLGQYLVFQLIRNEAVDLVKEVPLLHRYYVLLSSLQIVANSKSDFNRRTVEEAEKFVRAFELERDFFLGLLNRTATRNLAKKLLRLELELKHRI